MNSAIQFIGALLLISHLCSVAWCADTEALRLVALARKSVAWFDHSSTVVNISNHTLFERSAQDLRFEALVTCHREGPDKYHERRDVLSATDSGKLIPGSEGGYVLRAVCDASQFVFYHAVSERVSFTYERERVAKSRDALRCSAWSAAFLECLLEDSEIGPVSILDLLGRSDCRLLPDAEDIDGASCQVIEGESDAGTIRVWVAPDRDNLVLKYTLTFDRGGDKMREYQIICDNMKTRDVGGRTMIVEGRLRAHYVPTSEPRRTVEYAAKRKRIDVSPTFPQDAFRPTWVPDETHAVNLDALEAPIRHVWRGGKAVKDIDEALLEEIERQLMLPGEKADE